MQQVVLNNNQINMSSQTKQNKLMQQLIKCVESARKLLDESLKEDRLDKIEAKLRKNEGDIQRIEVEVQEIQVQLDKGFGKPVEEDE